MFALYFVCYCFFFFFFNDTATTEIYTLSLHDALPISFEIGGLGNFKKDALILKVKPSKEMVKFEKELIKRLKKLKLKNDADLGKFRSEEHTSELQSH